MSQILHTQTSAFTRCERCGRLVPCLPGMPLDSFWIVAHVREDDRLDGLAPVVPCFTPFLGPERVPGVVQREVLASLSPHDSALITWDLGPDEPGIEVGSVLGSGCTIP